MVVFAFQIYGILLYPYELEFDLCHIYKGKFKKLRVSVEFLSEVITIMNKTWSIVNKNFISNN